MNRVFPIIIVTALIALLNTETLYAAVVPADWITVENGSLNGVGFTVAGVNAPAAGIVEGENFDDLGHMFSPLISVDKLQYGLSNDLVFTFDTPITGLLLYAKNWRGGITISDDPAVTYDFDRQFDVLSGFTFSTVAGLSIIIDDDNAVFEDGVLRFLNAVTSLTVLSDGGPQALQSLTLGVEVSEVPLPGALSLMLCGLAGISLSRRRN
ncbi:MAG: hypothetical protein AAFX54_05860 [Pseudomonadota bacterium]